MFSSEPHCYSETLYFSMSYLKQKNLMDTVNTVRCRRISNILMKHHINSKIKNEASNMESNGKTLLSQSKLKLPFETGYLKIHFTHAWTIFFLRSFKWSFILCLSCNQYVGCWGGASRSDKNQCDLWAKQPLIMWMNWFKVNDPTSTSLIALCFNSVSPQFHISPREIRVHSLPLLLDRFQGPARQSSGAMLI